MRDFQGVSHRFMAQLFLGQKGILIMYKCYQDNIVAGKESFPMAWVLGENLIYLTIWSLAGYLLWPIWTLFGFPVLTILWILIVVVVQVLLKKHNCSGCYYYDKLCHLGWGKISSAMFKKNSGDPETGKKLSIFYILSPPLIFLSSLIYAVIKNPINSYWLGFAAFIILNIVSFPLRKKGCSLCTMREVCPGSAAKKKII